MRKPKKIEVLSLALQALVKKMTRSEFKRGPSGFHVIFEECWRQLSARVLSTREASFELPQNLDLPV